MKPATFDYHRASCLGDATEALSAGGDEVKVLAGGQSLLPMMNLRLARPELLVDIGGLHGLRGIHLEGGALHVGGLTRHEQIEHYPARLAGFEVLRRTAPLIGHRPIRTRGTLGGSLAHGDSAAEWCLLALLLDATVRTASVRGTRAIEAGHLFEGLFTTALEPDEILTSVVFPRPRRFAAFDEYARRHGDFALVAVGVAWDVVEDLIHDPRVVLGGVSTRPERCTAAEAALAGRAVSDATFAAAAAAAAGAAEPPSDMHASSDLRRRLVGTLLERACADAVALAVPPSEVREPEEVRPRG